MTDAACRCRGPARAPRSASVRGCAPAAAVVVRGRVGPGGGGRSGIHSLALPPCPRPAARAPGAGATGVGRDRPRRCAAFPPPEWLGGGDGVRLRTAGAVVRAGSACRAVEHSARRRHRAGGRRRSGSRGTDPAGRVAGGGGCRTARDHGSRARLRGRHVLPRPAPPRSARLRHGARRRLRGRRGGSRLATTRRGIGAQTSRRRRSRRSRHTPRAPR